MPIKDPAARRAAWAAAQRRRREASRRLGLCQLCSKRPARPGKNDCQLCYEATAERIKTRRARFARLDRCRDCGSKELETDALCGRCIKRQRDTARASARRRRLRRRLLPVLVLWLHWVVRLRG